MIVETEAYRAPEDRAFKVADEDIAASPRVGVDYAGADALLPWRFRIKNNKWTSPPAF